jgi:hypothetical protein
MRKLATSTVELEDMQDQACIVQGRLLDAESECIVLRTRMHEQDACIQALRGDLASRTALSIAAEKLAADTEARFQVCLCFLAAQQEVHHCGCERDLLYSHS